MLCLSFGAHCFCCLAGLAGAIPLCCPPTCPQPHAFLLHAAQLQLQHPSCTWGSLCSVSTDWHNPSTLTVPEPSSASSHVSFLSSALCVPCRMPLGLQLHVPSMHGGTHLGQQARAPARSLPLPSRPAQQSCVGCANWHTEMPSLLADPDHVRSCSQQRGASMKRA